MRLLAHAGAAALAVALVSLATPAEAYAQAPKGGAVQPLSVWHFGISADAMWYENARFVGAGESSTWSTGGHANLGYSRRFRTGSFGIGGWGGTIYYPEQDDFRQATYGGDLSLSLVPSTRTQVTLGQSFARTNTRQFTYATPDIPLPTTGVYYADSTFGVTHRLSQSWQMAVSSAFSARRYDAPSLVDGEQLGAGLEFGRLLGASGTMYTSYQFSNQWYADTQARAHQALLGFRYQPKRGASFEVTGGAAYLEPAEAWYPAGSARLSVSGRRTRASLAYVRDFGQAFGYGRQTVGDIGTAAAGWTPIGHLSFLVSYTYQYRRDSADNGYRIRSQVARGGVNIGTSKGFSAAASYSWEQNQTEGYPVLEGGRAMASISYGVEWR